MLYPTTSSSTDPTIRKAKKSPNFVAFNGLEQINILWAQCPSLVLKGSSWADTETLKESTETPKNKPCPQARTCPPQAFRHPPPAPPKTSQPSDLHWDPLVPQGSRRDLLGAWLLQHILQAGAGLGSFPCFSRQPALTATGVNSQCLHLPTLSSVYLSIIHPKFFHLPPVDTSETRGYEIHPLLSVSAPDNSTACAPLSLQHLRNFSWPIQRRFPNSEADALRAVDGSHIRASSGTVLRSIHQGLSLLCCLQLSSLTIPKNEYILITVFWELGLFSF